MRIQSVDLGRGGIKTSSLSFGTAGIGNLFREVSDEEANQALEVSYEGGVRYFDTAPHYGLGLAEQRLGDFLKSKPREEIIVSTKVGRLIRENPNFNGGQDDQGFAVSNRVHRVLDYSYDGVMKSIEESLARLQIEKIDIVFVHDPDNHEKESMEGAFPALEELRQSGVIRSYGAGMNQSAMLARFAANTELDVVMCAGRFSLLEQPAMEDLLPVAVRRNVSIVAAGVFNSGILATNNPQSGANYNYAPAPGEILARAQKLAKACQEEGFTLPQVAAQFPFLHSAIRVVCLGARNAEQAGRNVELYRSDVPKAFFEKLANQGLINPELVG